MFHRMDGSKVVENMDEFDDAREVVSSLSAEYEACESPDYVSWVCWRFLRSVLIIYLQSEMSRSMGRDFRRASHLCARGT